jgi:hypothetical protein
MSLLYTPPTGEYDQPFTYVFNAVNFIPGQNLLNQQIPMDLKVGDFVLRRVAGFANILAALGQFQIRDENGAYLEELPTNLSADSDQLAIVPEIRYPWSGAIRFDLYNLI